MGTGTSKPSVFSKGPTRESLLKSTQPMRILMNAAFKLMMEQITTKDLLSMSSPSECSKYVIIMGQSFDKYFKSIDVMPIMKGEKDKRTIYFQKADILTGQRVGDSQEAKVYAEQRKQVCLVLGYFFTRMFQIFAAIYFSVADDESIRPGVFVQDVHGVLPGELYGRQQGGPVLKPTEGVYFGGGISKDIKLEKYEFLRPFLNEIPGNPTTFKLSLDRTYLIYFKLVNKEYGRFLLISRLGDPDPGYDGKILIDILTAIYKDASSVTLNIEEAQDYENNIKLPKTYFKDVKVIFTKSINKDGKEEYKTTINGTPTGVPKTLYNLLAHIERNIVKASQQNKSIPPLSFTKILQNESINQDILKELGQPFERQYRQPAAYRNPLRAPPQIPYTDPLRAAYTDPLRAAAYTNPLRAAAYTDPLRAALYKRQYKSDKYINPYTDPVERMLYDRILKDKRRKDKERELEKLPEAIRSGSVYAALQPGMRPVPHCVARSLQLLNVDALTDLGGKKAFTYICKTKFLGTHPTGLPAPNESLSKSPGLNTLIALFHEFGDKDKSDGLKKQRLDALNILATLYKNTSAITDADFLKLANRYDPMICNARGFRDEAVALTNPAKFQAAKAGVLQLWNIQLQHVKNIESLVREMFVVNKAGALVINPQLMTVGIEGLDAIAQKLRGILLVYYGNCEKTYQDTVSKLVA